MTKTVRQAIDNAKPGHVICEIKKGQITLIKQAIEIRTTHGSMDEIYDVSSDDTRFQFLRAVACVFSMFIGDGMAGFIMDGDWKTMIFVKSIKGRIEVKIKG